MAADSSVLPVEHFPSAPVRRPVVPSVVLATLILVATEVMFFAGLISAFLIGKAGAVGWPPLGQPRAPVGSTAVNTLVLLASGVVLYVAERALEGRRPRTLVARLVAAAFVLGAGFVVLQGWEWTRLVWFGLTMRSSSYGAFFYLVVGLHALHAAAALVALAVAGVRLTRGSLSREAFWAVQMFWYFVVAVWPVLYVLVYLL
jgi:heme/copper-type cytochrome/quinol oxidase subunit 3